VHISRVVLSLALAATRISGQVPFASVEASLGRGAHTRSTAHVYYRRQATAFPRVAVTLRLWKASAIAPVVTVEHTYECLLLFVDRCAYTTECILAPIGDCERWFVVPSGNAFALGVEGAWGSYLLARLSAGVHKAQHEGRYADFELVARLGSHLGIVGDVRLIVARDRAGDSIWFRPISFGVCLN
jgi:hypothetical protein